MISKSSLLFCITFIASLIYSGQAISQEKNWTHFRGSKSNCIAENEKVPLKWDDSVVRWKTEIHDKGYSSSVIYGNQIWLTTATADGKELFAVCVDFNSGKIIHDIKVFTPEKVESKNNLNTYATPTPCIEKDFVYVHFGIYGTACIKTSDGSIVWKVTDYYCKHVQGPASSPIIYKNLIILHFEGTDIRYLVALDKSNGKLVWRSDRPTEPYEPLTVIGRKAYITPIIINVKGQDMLISNGSAICSAFDPANGKEIWRVVDGGESTISMPFTEKGIVYWYSGYQLDSTNSKYANIIAVNPDGKGDIAKTNIIWKKRDELTSNQMLTPVIKDGLIYTVNTRNFMKCIDATTGELVWSNRLSSNYNSSPVYANGNIWFFSVKGEVMVIKAGRKYEPVAQNQMDSGIWATPSFLRNSVILRTEKLLYRIGNK
jgi:outer membrane protein assembly factor BamB